MTGYKLRKFAQANHMHISSGIVYGNLHGFAVSLYEGSGWKKLTFNTHVPEQYVDAAILRRLNDDGIRRRFRIRKVQVTSDRISILFSDCLGCMHSVEAFIEWFIPLLKQCNATGYEICGKCGEVIQNDCWMFDEDSADHVHVLCGNNRWLPPE